MQKLDFVTDSALRTDIPTFRAGDTVRVNVKVVEGNRSRIQAFQGIVIRRHGGGIGETFTVRKMSFGTGVERTFRCTRQPLTPLRSSPAVMSVVRSSTTCASCVVRQRRSKKSVSLSLSDLRVTVTWCTAQGGSRKGAALWRTLGGHRRH